MILMVIPRRTIPNGYTQYSSPGRRNGYYVNYAVTNRQIICRTIFPDVGGDDAEVN